MTFADPDAQEGTARPTPPPSRWAGWLATGVAALTPLVAYIGHLGYAPVIALVGLLSLPLFFRNRRPDPGQGLLLALVAWAVISMAWSIAVPAHPDFHTYHGVESMTGVKLVLQLALYGAFVAASLTLSKAAGARTSLVLTIGLLAVSVLFLLEAMFKAPLYLWYRAAIGQPQRPDWALRDVAGVSYVLALLFWPATLRLERPRWRFAAGAMAAATVIGAWLLNADAPLAALVVSTLVFAAVRLWGRPALMAWMGVLALYFLAAPLLVHALGPGPLIHPAADDIREQSWAARLDIWRFAASRILERPFFGWGLDAARMFSPNIPLHTHNAAIQIWLELGAVGASIAALFWLWLGGRIDALEARDRPLAATAAACASAYLTIGALSFGVWQEWWLALGALSIAACAALAAARRGGDFQDPSFSGEGSESRRPEDPAPPP
ncbi:MAG TPA: O-antigen ligase family protein [Caulobacteraceae bacterium]|jgi:O-antigen ligase|nr:O-antigen ligase family protein [Caulobacteraceae bacterium]